MRNPDRLRCWALAPTYAAVRKTERFKNYVRKAGLLEYWRAKGWLEFRHPTTGERFRLRAALRHRPMSQSGE
jgi:hypothetical protein